LKRGLWLLLFVFILGSVPSFFAKHNIEESAKKVEYVMDYERLVALSQNSTSEDYIHQSLMKLKRANVTSIAIHESSLYSLQKKGYLSIFAASDLKKVPFASSESTDFPLNYTYVYVYPGKEYAEVSTLIENDLRSTLTGRKIALNGKEFYEIKYPKKRIEKRPLSILESEVELVTKDPYNFKVVARISNGWRGREDKIFSQLDKFKREGHLSKILFLGKETPGFLNGSVDEKVISSVKSLAPIGYFEFYDASQKQKGMDEFSVKTDYNIVRTQGFWEYDYSLLLANPHSLSERMDIAIKDRNIRMVYFSPYQVGRFTPEDMVDKTISGIHGTKHGFELGAAELFSHNESFLFKMSKISALFAGLVSALLIFYRFLPKYLFAFAFLEILGVCMLLLTGMDGILFKVFALGSAISFPVLSLVVLMDKLENGKMVGLKGATGLFMMSSSLSVIGGFVIASMHTGLKYSLYIDQFRGVGILHLVPPVFILLFLILFYHNIHLSKIVSLSKEPIRIYHLFVIGVIGLVGLFYLSRTGNGGTLLPYEREFRMFLEESLYARPRTKEFLIGHPVLLVAIFYWNRYKWAKWLTPVAVIGQLSMVSTFTHLHSPVLISSIRTFNGLWIGLFVGLLFILAFEAGKRIVKIKKS